MQTTWRSLFSFIVVAGFLFGINGCDNGAAKRAAERAQKDDARAQLERIADDLDKRTTETGAYVRVKEDEIKENDRWGTQVQVGYSQDGVSEVLNVRSAGPDRRFHTGDDVVTTRIAVNFKGVGEGIKKNTEETAKKAAKGLVKGTFEGIKESVKDELSLKKKKDGDPDPTE